MAGARVKRSRCFPFDARNLAFFQDSCLTQDGGEPLWCERLRNRKKDVHIIDLFRSYDDFPDCFRQNPSFSCIGSSHFAFLMRFEFEHTLAWRERAHSSTARAFNKLCVALLKTLEGDFNQPWKRAFGRFACLHGILHRFAQFCRVLLSIGGYRFLFWFRFPFCWSISVFLTVGYNVRYK